MQSKKKIVDSVNNNNDYEEFSISFWFRSSMMEGLKTKIARSQSKGNDVLKISCILRASDCSSGSAECSDFLLTGPLEIFTTRMLQRSLPGLMVQNGPGMKHQYARGSRDQTLGSCPGREMKVCEAILTSCGLGVNVGEGRAGVNKRHPLTLQW